MYKVESARSQHYLLRRLVLGMRVCTFGVHQGYGLQRGGVQQVHEFTVGGVGGHELHLPHHDVLHKDVVLAVGGGTQPSITIYNLSI